MTKTRNNADLHVKSVFQDVMNLITAPVSRNSFVEELGPEKSLDFANRFDVIMQNRLDKARSVLVKDRCECANTVSALQERMGSLDAMIDMIRVSSEE